MKDFKRHALNVAIAVIAASFCLAAGRAPSQTVSGASSSFEGELSRPPCPLHSAAEWQSFLRRHASAPGWTETCEDSPCDPKFHDEVSDKIESVFESCASEIDRNPRLASCTGNMRRLAPIWLRQHDEVSYGFAVPNHEYLTRQEDSARPAGMMKVPDAIVRALPDRRAVEKAARDNGFRYLTHDSAIDGFRTFVFVPDPKGRFDQWMLLNLQKGDEKIEANTPFSILVVQKKDAAGHDLPRVRLYFRDYNVSTNRKTGSYRLALFEENNGKCYSCHSNGVRQLIPRRTPTTEAEPVRGERVADARDFGYRRLMEFNRKLRSYGSPDWDGMITQESNGPPLGKAQGCTACHDGHTRNPLWILTSHKQVRQKVVNELAMPPEPGVASLLERLELKGPHAMSPAEKESLLAKDRDHEALFQAFENARGPALRDWFLQTPCE